MFINPATGKALAHLPHATTADLDHALKAAEKGLAVWRATSAYDRAKVMRKMHAESLAELVRMADTLSEPPHTSR